MGGYNNMMGMLAMRSPYSGAQYGGSGSAPAFPPIRPVGPAYGGSGSGSAFPPIHPVGPAPVLSQGGLNGVRPVGPAPVIGGGSGFGGFPRPIGGPISRFGGAGNDDLTNLMLLRQHLAGGGGPFGYGGY